MKNRTDSKFVIHQRRPSLLGIRGCMTPHETSHKGRPAKPIN